MSYEILLYKTKDWAIYKPPLKPWVNSGVPERISSSCSTIDTRRVNRVKNPVERGLLYIFLNNLQINYKFHTSIWNICLIFNYVAIVQSSLNSRLKGRSVGNLSTFPFLVTVMLDECQEYISERMAFEQNYYSVLKHFFFYSVFFFFFL